MGEKYNGRQRKAWYNNFLYDSTLEAQWAAFWNDVAILAVPHPATFKTGKYCQGKEICYTPDFYLPDYDVFCEVKPSDGLVNGCNFQRKVSAAMEDHYTPVADGLLILGPMNNFGSTKNQKCSLGGEFYRWSQNSIRKSYWRIGRYGNSENGISIHSPSDSFYSSNYPCFSKHASVELRRDYNNDFATEIVYKAIFNAIFAVKNGYITFEESILGSTKEAEAFEDGLPFIDDEDDDDI